MTTTTSSLVPLFPVSPAPFPALFSARFPALSPAISPVRFPALLPALSAAADIPLSLALFPVPLPAQPVTAMDTAAMAATAYFIPVLIPRLIFLSISFSCPVRMPGFHKLTFHTLTSYSCKRRRHELNPHPGAKA